MGRTTPTSTEIVAREKEQWKPFRQALDRSKRPIFDDMMDTSQLHLMAMSNAIMGHPIPIQRILMSIIFEQYRQLDILKIQLDPDRMGIRENA